LAATRLGNSVCQDLQQVRFGPKADMRPQRFNVR
jgi:hypothetical protein